MRETIEEKDKERWQSAFDLFEEAFPLAAPAREQLLKSIGAHDAPLRQTVEELLAAHRETEATEFLEAPAFSYQPMESNEHQLVGQRVGA